MYNFKKKTNYGYNSVLYYLLKMHTFILSRTKIISYVRPLLYILYNILNISTKYMNLYTSFCTYSENLIQVL